MNVSKYRERTAERLLQPEDAHKVDQWVSYVVEIQGEAWVIVFDDDGSAFLHTTLLS